MRLVVLVLITVFLFSNKLSAQTLVSSEYKGSRTLQQMQADFGILMQNGIEMYKILYETPDINGNLDTASGLLVIPIRDTPLQYPLLCYQHGTVSSKTDVPSELQGGYELATVFGGLGYLTAAPDFLGLGESRGFHPYVHADSEASAGIDMMRAARDYAAENGVGVNEQVFITGYSQGGHAAAALHLEIQENHSEEFDIVASAPMSGPYSISGEMRKVILSDEPYSFPAYLAYTALSYNEVYGLFDQVEDYFKPLYATRVQQFYDGNITLTSLNSILLSLLAGNEGSTVTKYMLQDSVLEGIANNLMHPANLALADNDVYDWAPEAPTRLLYCMADDQVLYTNSIVADSVMNLNGAPDVDAIDVNPEFDHGECVEPAVINTAIFFMQYQDLLPVATMETLRQDQVKAYPNPVEDQLVIEHEFADAQVQLLDLNGNVLLTEQLTDQRARIRVNMLPTGLYLLRVITPAGQWVDKVMVGRF